MSEEENPAEELLEDIRELRDELDSERAKLRKLMDDFNNLRHEMNVMENKLEKRT